MSNQTQEPNRNEWARQIHKQGSGAFALEYIGEAVMPDARMHFNVLLELIPNNERDSRHGIYSATVFANQLAGEAERIADEICATKPDRLDHARQIQALGMAGDWHSRVSQWVAVINHLIAESAQTVFPASAHVRFVGLEVARMLAECRAELDRIDEAAEADDDQRRHDARRAA